MFEEHRGLLYGLAYRMLGSAADAEDVVQDAYLRWRGADIDRIATPPAWLATVVTNLCRNRLTSARARRERYTGPWLPEPVPTADGALGPLETVERRDSVSLGLLHLLERLTPAERAAFVLRTAFGYGHRDIAGVLDVEEAHARQLYRRARARVDAAERRFPVDPARHRDVVERFYAAVLHGDLPGLERLLADDVTSWADGGGRETAARHPVTGRARVARYLTGLAAHPRAVGVTATVAEVNGAPALVVRQDGELRAIMVADAAGGRVIGVRTVVNPDKLAFAAARLG